MKDSLFPDTPNITLFTTWRNITFNRQLIHTTDCMEEITNAASGLKIHRHLELRHQNLPPMKRPIPSIPAAEQKPRASYHHYLPVSETIFDGGLYVTSVGEMHVGTGEPYPPAQHPSLYQFTWQEGRTLPEFSLMLITSGHGDFETKSIGRVKVAAGTAIMLFPGGWHRYRPDPATGWSEKWMHFNGELAHRLLDQGWIRPGQPVWRPKDFKRVKAELDRLLALVRRNPAKNSLRITLQALALISATLTEDEAISLSPGEHTDSVADPLIQQAVHYIWTHGHRELTVDQVVDAAAAGVTRRTLERRFRHALGRGILEEIIACRFSRAERLVLETDLPLKTIVGLAGFGSMENMRRVFLSRTGLSPAGCREALLHGSIDAG